MYGNKFRKLRVEQNISLEQAAKNVISISTLSRWENDKLDINFSQLAQLLGNIHLTLREFANYCNINSSHIFSVMVSKAYVSEDINQLNELTQQQLQRYYNSRDTYELFLAAMANNCLYDLTQTNLFTENDINRLNFIFSHVKYWSEYYIKVFSNSVFLIKPQVQYQASSKILEQLHLKDFSSWDNYINVICAILNSITSLIFLDVDLAQKLLKKLDAFNFPSLNSYFQIKRKFLKELIIFKINKNNEEKINNIISSLKMLDLPNIAHDFSELFNRIKKL